MAGVSVTLTAQGGQAGGSGGDAFTSTDYANAAAAVAAVSNGFIVFANPVDPTQSTSLGKSRAVSVSAIREIVSL